MKNIFIRILTAIIAIPITVLGLIYYIIYGNQDKSNDKR